MATRAGLALGDPHPSIKAALMATMTKESFDWHESSDGSLSPGQSNGAGSGMSGVARSKRDFAEHSREQQRGGHGTSDFDDDSGNDSHDNGDEGDEEYGDGEDGDDGEDGGEDGGEDDDGDGDENNGEDGDYEDGDGAHRHKRAAQKQRQQSAVSRASASHANGNGGLDRSGSFGSGSELASANGLFAATRSAPSTTLQAAASHSLQAAAQAAQAAAAAQKKAGQRIGRACIPCNRAKSSCETQRPCARCVRLNRIDQCVDVEHKQRGRKSTKSLAAANGGIKPQPAQKHKKPRLDAPAPTAPTAFGSLGGGAGPSSGVLPTAVFGFPLAPEIAPTAMDIFANDESFRPPQASTPHGAHSAHSALGRPVLTSSAASKTLASPDVSMGTGKAVSMSPMVAPSVATALASPSLPVFSPSAMAALPPNSASPSMYSSTSSTPSTPSIPPSATTPTSRKPRELVSIDTVLASVTPSTISPRHIPVANVVASPLDPVPITPHSHSFHASSVSPSVSAASSSSSSSSVTAALAASTSMSGLPTGLHQRAGFSHPADPMTASAMDADASSPPTSMASNGSSGLALPYSHHRDAHSGLSPRFLQPASAASTPRFYDSPSQPLHSIFSEADTLSISRPHSSAGEPFRFSSPSASESLVGSKTHPSSLLQPPTSADLDAAAVSSGATSMMLATGGATGPSSDSGASSDGDMGESGSNNAARESQFDKRKPSNLSVEIANNNGSSGSGGNNDSSNSNNNNNNSSNSNSSNSNNNNNNGANATILSRSTSGGSAWQSALNSASSLLNPLTPSAAAASVMNVIRAASSGVTSSLQQPPLELHSKTGGTVAVPAGGLPSSTSTIFTSILKENSGSIIDSNMASLHLAPPAHASSLEGDGSEGHASSSSSSSSSSSRREGSMLGNLSLNLRSLISNVTGGASRSSSGGDRALGNEGGSGSSLANSVLPPIETTDIVEIDTNGRSTTIATMLTSAPAASLGSLTCAMFCSGTPMDTLFLAICIDLIASRLVKMAGSVQGESSQRKLILNRMRFPVSLMFLVMPKDYANCLLVSLLGQVGKALTPFDIVWTLQSPMERSIADDWPVASIKLTFISVHDEQDPSQVKALHASVYVNQEMERLFGYTRQEVLHMCVNNEDFICRIIHRGSWHTSLSCSIDALFGIKPEFRHVVMCNTKWNSQMRCIEAARYTFTDEGVISTAIHTYTPLPELRPPSSAASSARI